MADGGIGGLIGTVKDWLQDQVLAAATQTLARHTKTLARHDRQIARLGRKMGQVEDFMGEMDTFTNGLATTVHNVADRIGRLEQAAATGNQAAIDDAITQVRAGFQPLREVGNQLEQLASDPAAPVPDEPPVTPPGDEPTTDTGGTV